MFRRALRLIVILAVLGLLGFWVLTRPKTTPEEAIAGLTADPVRGEYVFRAAGCASCHVSQGETEASLKLGGGLALESPFGTFYAPNISPDPDEGIGAWRPIDLVNALKHGVSPQGEHYYPALPYASYTHMTDEDVVSLFAYLRTLPPVPTPSKPHDVGFPFSIRRLVGGWKLLYLREGWAVGEIPPEAETGRYIAEALAHCGECHTPRDVFGGLKLKSWLGGAPNPAGRGHIPNITPGGLDWPQADILTFFQWGQKPDFDSAGGDMASVIEHLQTLPEADLASLAAYLKAVPAVADAE